MAPTVATAVWLNNIAVRKFGPAVDNPQSTSGVQWVGDLRAASDTVGDEWDAFTEAGGELPDISEIFGGHQGNVDSWWRGGPIISRGLPLPFMSANFPETCAALLRVPGMHSAIWSVMGPGGYLPEHKGVNAGATRLLLGVRCGQGAVLELGREEIPFDDGAVILFDDTYLHASHNDSGAPRVVILCDLIRPAGSYTTVNRAFQELHHLAQPVMRRAPARAAALYGDLNPHLPSEPLRLPTRPTRPTVPAGGPPAVTGGTVSPPAIDPGWREAAWRGAEDDRPGSLLDPVAQQEFSERGYTVVDLLSPDAVEELLDVCHRFHPTPDTTWECDFFTTDQDCKLAVGQAIGNAFSEPLSTVLVDHVTYFHNFVLNWPGADGGLQLHEHSSTVDESYDRSIVAWCAITPTTEENGTLHFVPRSHHMQVGPRAERGPAWFYGHEELLLRDHLDAVALRPGQAVLFDNALLHCSFPNSTDEVRIAAVATLCRRSAQLRYHQWEDDRTVSVFELDPEFFMTTTSADLEFARPDGLTLIDRRPGHVEIASIEEIEAVIPRGSCSTPHGPLPRR